jgi:hypothetical protein
VVGKIDRIGLRKVWAHEAHDFTTWLEENIDVLNEVLDANIVSVDREQNAGSFSVDLVGEDEDGNTVIIENQLEKSNHDHLGKVITYLTAFEAKIAVWIVSDPRPEHVRAIAWLNEASAASFYLIKLEAIRIGESAPAPLLTRIVGPSVEARVVGDTKKEMSNRHRRRFDFWKGLLELSRTKTTLHSGISPSGHYWVGTGAGTSGIGLNYTVRQHDGKAELYIDADKDSGEGNKAIFDKLYASKEKIEKEFGGPLNWERLEAKRACRISMQIDDGGWNSDETVWPQTHSAMIDAMIRLEKSLRPYLNKIK